MFKEAGFEWREAGCSMCLAMNPEQACARRAMCFDLEPQFRRSARAGWADASCFTGDGGGGGVCWAFCRYPGVEVKR